MKSLTEEELEFFKQLQEKTQDSHPAAVFMSNVDFVTLLKKELEKQEDILGVLKELDYFNSGSLGSENFILYDEGWIEAVLENGSEGVYVGVYFYVILENKTCRRRIATAKMLEDGFSEYKQMGMLAGAITHVGNELLRKHFWKTLNLLEINRIERLQEEGVTFEDLVAEIQRRVEGKLVTTDGKATELDKIYNTRILLHLLNMWRILHLMKSLLKDVKYTTTGCEHCELKYVFYDLKSFSNHVRLLNMNVEE